MIEKDPKTGLWRHPQPVNSTEQMIEKDPKTGLWRHPQPVSRDSLNNTEEMIDNFVAECERQAAKLEITVDYYIKEFI